MKLFYIANIRIPTEKAHGLAVMKMCESFATNGLGVTLIVPRRLNVIKLDPFEQYGVDKNFQIKRLPVIDLIPLLGKFGFVLESVMFATIAFVYCIFNKAEIIYGRDELSLSLLFFFRKNVVWESHTAKPKWLVKGLLKRSKKLVVISNGLREYYMAMGVPSAKILVAPSGVDISKFEEIRETKEELRKKLSLPLDKKIVAYVGKEKSMGKTKGVGELEEILTLLSQKNPEIYPLLVTEAHPSLVPMYMKASDILVMNYPNTEHYAKYMSPLKMFEYMASGAKIVTTDIPSVREILDESMAYFFNPGDTSELIKAIGGALKNEEVGKNNSIKATEYSWNNRSKKVMEFII